MKNTKLFIVIITTLIIVGVIAYSLFIKNKAINTQDSSSQYITNQDVVTIDPNNLDINATQNVMVGMANPAAVNCVKLGGDLSIKKDENGNETGICKKGKKSCEEWALFRGECSL